MYRLYMGYYVMDAEMGCYVMEVEMSWLCMDAEKAVLNMFKWARPFLAH